MNALLTYNQLNSILVYLKKSLLLFIMGVALMPISCFADPATYAYWRFEDGNAIGKDFSGNERSLAALGEVATGPLSAPATLDFNPVPHTGEANEYSLRAGKGALVLESSEGIDGNEFTVEALVRPNIAGLFGTIIARGEGGKNNRWRFCFNTTNALLHFGLSSEGVHFVPFDMNLPDFKAGDYIYVAVAVKVDSSNGASITLYAKNLSRGTELLHTNVKNPDLTTLFETNAPITVGCIGDLVHTWPGEIDEVRVSSRILKQDELLISEKPL